MKNIKGFSLIEILVVVGFIAFASVGTYQLINKISLTNKATENNRIVSMIMSASKSLYATKATTSGVSNSILTNAQAVPVGYIDVTDPNIIKDAFGSPMVITSANIGAGSNNGFSINIQNVPKQICIELLSKGHSNYDTINVNGVFVKPIGFTIDLTALTVQCHQLEFNDIVINYFK